MKTASLEDWEAVGSQSKKARRELLSLLNQTKGKLPIAMNEAIIKSIQSLDRFRSNAENRMMQTGISKDTHIFYG